MLYCQVLHPLEKKTTRMDFLLSGRTYTNTHFPTPKRRPIDLRKTQVSRVPRPRPAKLSAGSPQNQNES